MYSMLYELGKVEVPEGDTFYDIRDLPEKSLIVRISATKIDNAEFIAKNLLNVLNSESSAN
jgi:hypothetical protein